jgi:hypothetical protein
MLAIFAAGMGVQLYRDTESAGNHPTLTVPTVHLPERVIPFVPPIVEGNPLAPTHTGEIPRGDVPRSS